jgi:hypothetical protein
MRIGWAIGLVLCFGCGRVGFDPELPGGGDGSSARCASSGWVQSNGNHGANVTTISINYASAQRAGDTNIVVVQWSSANGSVTGVSDSAGNSYSLAIGPTFGQLDAQYIFYASGIAAAAAGSNTVTVTLSAPQTQEDLTIFEYAGLATTSPLDGTADGHGIAPGAATTPITTSNACDLLFAAARLENNATAAGLGYAVRWGGKDIYGEEQVASSAGMYFASASQDLSGDYVIQLVAFKKLLDAPAAPIALVQGSSSECANCSVIAATLLTGQQADDTFIIAVFWGNQTSTISSLLDSQGNQYSLAVGPVQGLGASAAIYYAPAVKPTGGGSDRISITLSAAAPSIFVYATEYSGLSATSPFDVGLGTFGATAMPDSGAVTTSSAPELVFGAVLDNSNTANVTAGSGFRTIFDVHDTRDGFIEDFVAPSAGSYNASATFSVPNGWASLVATFH